MKIPLAPFFLKIKEHFSSGNVLVFWYHYYKLFVFFGFLIALSIGGWNYYYNVHQYRFSDEEKKQYIDSYFKETAFKEARFRTVVNSLTERARVHNETFSLSRDVFFGK